jgi:hypothetical protein
MSQYITPIRFQGQPYRLVFGADRRLQEVFFQLYTPQDDVEPSYSSLAGMGEDESFLAAFGLDTDQLLEHIQPAAKALKEEILALTDPERAKVQGIELVDANTVREFPEVTLPEVLSA